MRIYDLAGPRGTTGTGNQAAVDLSSQPGRDEMLLQIEFSSTGSAKLQGRIDSSMSFIDITPSYTTDTIVPVAYVPELRLVVDSNAGTIIAKLASD